MWPSMKHRDLLRLVVLLAVVRSLVLVTGAGSAGRPPRRAGRVTAPGAGDLEPAGCDPPARPVPAGAGRELLGGPSADCDRRRRTRRGRRAPSARKRGSRGARHREGRGRPTGGAGLIIGVLNIQSIKPKILELAHQLHCGKYDLMCLTETWLKKYTPSRLLVLPGY